MIIQNASKNHVQKRNMLHIRLKWMLFGLGGMVLILFVAIMSMGYGMMLYKTTKASTMAGFLKNIVRTKLNIIPNYIKGAFSSPEHFYLDIKHEDFQKIVYFRKISLERGKITADVKEENIPAKVTLNKTKYKISLNMTGQNLDHLGRSDKWSFRVKVKRKKSILGMKEFSLLVPNGRVSQYNHPISEWICHQLEKEEGIISLRYEFVDVTINGKYIGVYALEEHFEKRLIENNNLRDGLLFKPNLAKIHIYNQKKIMVTPALKAQSELLRVLWKSFFIGDIPTSKIFDIEKLAKYYAIADLVNGHHTHWPGNIYFYFNPITMRIEPIGREWSSPYHNEAQHKSSPLYLNNFQYSPFLHEKLFKDPVFVEKYISTLSKITKPEYLNNFFRKIDGLLQEKLNILNKDYFAYSYSNKYLYDSQLNIKNIINPNLSKSQLAVYYDSFKNNILHLTFVNQQSLPLEILSITSDEIDVFNPVGKEIVFGDNDGKHKLLKFKIPKGVILEKPDLNAMKIKYKVLGTKETRQSIIAPWLYKEREKYADWPIQSDIQYTQRKFLEIDEIKKLIKFKPGKWKIEKNIVIPKGYRLVCDGGTQLDLLKSSTIVSYSPLSFLGSAVSPISISSSDFSGQGLVVMNVKEQSILEHVVFEGLSNPSKLGWSLSGAVNFYEAPVVFNNCTFKNNKSEDGLNIVRSRFELNNCYFYNAQSDAFDCDFCTGEINKSTFKNSGNDAIDVSGSSIKLKNVNISLAGDKGLSVGENSKVIADSVVIEKANIAAASKDLSILRINNMSVANSRIGFAAFQKKTEFGPAKIIAEEVSITNVDKLHFIENKSTLTLNGKSIKGAHKDHKLLEKL
jgi:hypothetical protein